MRKEYLRKLEDLLDEYNVPDRKEILKKYKKRYDFGQESELDDDEIEDMLGTPEEVVRKYVKIDEPKEEPKYEKIKYDEDPEVEIIEEKKSFFSKKTKEARAVEYTIEVSSVADDIIFTKSKDDGIHAELRNIDEENYNIAKTDNSLKINYLKRKYFSINRNSCGEIVVEVPKNTKLKLIKVGETSGDISMTCDIIAESVSIGTVSGDFNAKDIDADEFHMKTVSGDASIDNLASSDVILNTVSGDIEIGFLVSDETYIETVSGDVDVRDCKGHVTSSSVSGDVTVNGEEYGKSVVKYVKGFIKR